jgi:formylglycine-generating enzyme required for sulfatase activity
MAANDGPVPVRTLAHAARLMREARQLSQYGIEVSEPILTEAEWEYAARAGTTSAYYWGNEIGKGNANCKGCGSLWDGKGTAPVGSLGPNAFGLYDMLGNAAEWVEDCWNENYDQTPKDGSAAIVAGCVMRVTRSGGWMFTPPNIRVATRGGDSPQLRVQSLGIRVGRTLVP